MAAEKVRVVCFYCVLNWANAIRQSKQIPMPMVV